MKTFKHRSRTERFQSIPEQVDVRTEVDDDQVDRVLDDIDCCLAESTEVDDEQAAADAFDNLYVRAGDAGWTWDQLKDEGDILRAQFAHTNYVQRKRCCACGCPWND